MPRDLGPEMAMTTWWYDETCDDLRPMADVRASKKMRFPSGREADRTETPACQIKKYRYGEEAGGGSLNWV